MKVAFLDIEANNLNADNGVGFMLCASVKLWHQPKTIKTFRIDQNPKYLTCLYDDSYVWNGIADWMGKEDPEFIVTFNGDRYDIPYINTRRIGSGAKTLPPCRYIDHWKTGRYNLKLRNLSLNTMAEHLGVEHHKTRFEPPVWQRASYGSKPDLDKIVHHCELDIVVLEECHDKVLPILRRLRGLL